MKRIFEVLMTTKTSISCFIVLSYIHSLDYKQFGTIANQESLIIEEDPMSFNSNNNQFITYIWTDLSNGPQCRIKFTVIKDICTKQNQTLGAKCIFF